MNTKIKTFAERLKEYRTILNQYTLLELEKMTGVPAQTLNRYELGQRIPKIDIAETIAMMLHVDSMWLQGYDVDMKRSGLILRDEDLFQDHYPCKDVDISDFNLTEAELKFIKKYQLLNEAGKKKADDYINDLLENEKYTTSDSSIGGGSDNAEFSKEIC